MVIYLIRHAQSFNNTLNSSVGRIQDPGLTPLGVRQAAALADYTTRREDPVGADWRLGRIEVTRLISSPMCRALQTAHPISSALGIPLEVWVDIHEWGGIFLDDADTGGVRGCPGKTRDDILREFPGSILPDTITDEGWWKGGREDTPTSQGRAIKAADCLRTWASTDDSIGVVTHAVFLDFLLKALLSHLPGEDFSFWHSNTGVTRIDIGSDGRLNLRYVNQTKHLALELIS